MTPDQAYKIVSDVVLKRANGVGVEFVDWMKALAVLGSCLPNSKEKAVEVEDDGPTASPS